MRKDRSPEQEWVRLKDQARTDLQERIDYATDENEDVEYVGELSDDIHETADTCVPIYNYERAILAAVPDVWAQDPVGEFGEGAFGDTKDLMHIIGIHIYMALMEYLNDEVSQGTFGIDHNGERIE